MLGGDYSHKVAGYDFHLLRKKHDVQSMWGDLDPQWQRLKSQLETKGLGWYSGEREERLFTDVKKALCTDENTAAWEAWSSTQYQLRQLRQPAAPLVFPGEQELFSAKSGGRPSNWSSIYPHSAGCIYEGTKEEKAG